MKVRVINSQQVTVEGHALDAEQLDRLIEQLLTARSTIAPPVPLALPTDRSILVIDNPETKIGRNTQGGISMFLRHEGAGWFAIRWDAARAGAHGAQMLKALDPATVAHAQHFAAQQLADGDKLN